ncbi:MAG TPA: RDD family protein [Anaeromyxobacteraceae bacterium]|nr:RDD family protein [Anaeromyxobacteraceae bacterium]
MKSVGREDSPYPKADLTLRVLARLADFVFALVLARLHTPIGPLLAAAYLLLADGISHGQSFGKRIFGVRAVVLSRRAPAGFRESILRNAPFGLVMIFVAVPLLWPVLLVAGVPIVAFETWQVFDDKLGIRIGDFFADTQVVDAKVFTRDAEVAAARRLGIAGPTSPPASVSRRDAPRDAPRGAA